MIPCGRCEEYKPQDQFEQNDKLELGIHPWCRDCIEWLALLPNQPDVTVGQLRQARQDYRVAYQKSYQNAYKQRLDGKTTTKKRVTERFTSDAPMFGKSSKTRLLPFLSEKEKKVFGCVERCL